MTTKEIDKSIASNRSGVSRRASGNMSQPTREQAGTTTKAGAPAKRHSGQGRVTKQAQLLQLLNRPEGATVDNMMQATDWQQHSVRGFLAGTVKKKMGLALTSSKAEGEVRRYRIATRRGR